jgi:predicted nucleotidyltransferase
VIRHAYPTSAHDRAAQEITSFFASRDETDAVLLVCSCARGKATVDSCLDMQVIAPAGAVTKLDDEFRRFESESEAIAELLRTGRFSDLHLDVIDGTFVPGIIDEEGIDDLEVGVGNLFVYSVPLFVRGDRLEELRADWLPYYGDTLRRERLEAACWFILDNNLARIPWFLDRDLYFQAFDRFHRAFQGFLSAYTSRAVRIPSRTTSGSESKSSTTLDFRTSMSNCRGSSSSTGSRAELWRKRQRNCDVLPRAMSLSTSCTEVRMNVHFVFDVLPELSSIERAWRQRPRRSHERQLLRGTSPALPTLGLLSCPKYRAV